MLATLMRHRRLLTNLVRADLRQRYSGSSAGWLWTLLHPLAQIAIFSVVFTSVMSGRGQGFAHAQDYVLYLCIGLFPWLAFSEAVSRGSAALLAGAAHLRQGLVVEELLAAKVTASATISALAALCLLLAISPLLGLQPMWSWLLLPVPFLALMASALGLAMICGMLAVFFKDLLQAVQIALPLLMWSAPIIYVPEILPPWARQALPLHPLYPSLAILHDLFLHGRPAEPGLWVAMLLWPAALLAVAGLVTARLRSEVRDAI